MTEQGKKKVPPEEWYVQMPFDSSDYLDRPPVRYEDDEGPPRPSEPGGADDFSG